MSVEDEVERRLPEITLIEDDELRSAVGAVISEHFPKYFWDVPATASGRFHNPFCRGKHGLWIHTKMVFTAFERIAESMQKLGVIDSRQADHARAAILLHDMLKYGAPPAGDSTKRNHDVLAGAKLATATDLPHEVVSAVRTHNGPWYAGPEPSWDDDPVGTLVHIADMIAADKNTTVGVWKPADEIADRYPNLPRASL